MRLLALVLLLTLAAGGLTATLRSARRASTATATSSPPRQPAPQRPARARRAPPRAERPPQFVVTSFDGSGGARLWSYWRSVAKRAHARFTFFVSGVYLLDWAHHDAYAPPR